jgi:hypothetical protein
VVSDYVTTSGVTCSLFHFELLWLVNNVVVALLVLSDCVIVLTGTTGIVWR